jgi:hypothetical protein
VIVPFVFPAPIYYTPPVYYGPQIVHSYSPPPVVVVQQPSPVAAGTIRYAPAEEKRLTLLAFKDHAIYAINGYFFEGGQIHFVTSYGQRSARPLEQLDLELTQRLNRERGVLFEIPQ